MLVSLTSGSLFPNMSRLHLESWHVWAETEAYGQRPLCAAAQRKSLCSPSCENITFPLASEFPAGANTSLLQTAPSCLCTTVSSPSIAGMMVVRQGSLEPPVSEGLQPSCLRTASEQQGVLPQSPSRHFKQLWPCTQQACSLKHHTDGLFSKLRNEYFSPGWCGSVGECRACEPKGCRFDSHPDTCLGYRPGLQ